jgi:hypothetical protein
MEAPMNELSPRVRAIVDAGRAADDPTGEDRARIRGAVLRAIAAPVALGAASAKAAKGGAGVKIAGGGLAAKIGGAIGVAVVAGAGLFAAASRENVGGLRAEEALSALVAAVGLPDPPAVEAPAPLQNEAPEPAPESPREAVIRQDLARAGGEPRGGLRGKISLRAVEGAPASSLEEETKRLREAHKALRSGQPERALELLEEQSATFAAGELREERAAARVFALCEAGKTSEAKAAAKAFLIKSPRSPLAGRVRGACAGKDNPAGD